MEFERVTTADHPLYQDALALYRASFPPHEQREAASQQAILGNEAYHFDLLLDAGEWVGEALYWDAGDFLYLEHFCIRPELRNRRYGQKALEVLCRRPLILEIDPPVDEISIRRKGFYERCGLAANPYPHVHPPYHAGNRGHDLVLMTAPRQITSQEFDEFTRFLRGVVMKDVY